MKNVLVILCDQLRPDFLSCYGNSQINTPNIDSLAKDGVLFEHATTASPVCSPARASMMTGRFVTDHGVWTNDTPFRDGLEYIPKRMKENGYACGAFGKLHHFPAKDSKGFDLALQMEENRLAIEDDYYKYLKKLHPEIENLYGHDKEGSFKYSLEEYYEHWIADNAMKFIEQNKEKPIFAWVSFQGPHGPLDAPSNNGISSAIDISDPIQIDLDLECEVARYRKSRESHHDMDYYRNYRTKYAELIQILDYEIGRIIEFLKYKGLYENTVIMFSADHGNTCGDYGTIQKGPMIYASQLEIPMIIANHPELPQNVVSDVLVSNLDLGTTSLKIAKDDIPLGYSRCMAEMFLNIEKQRDVIFSEFCDSVKIVSNKTHRLAYYPFAKEYELVEINNETVNLASKAEYQQLKAELLADIIDFTLMSKPIHIEAHDFTPKVQKGLTNKYPNNLDDLEIVFPLASQQEYKNLENDGLDADYNSFCIEREEKITRFYGKYWSGEKKFKQKY